MTTVKGMVLAAGFGNRLKPITNDFPKPLVPILGTNPLTLALHQLKQAGISDIAVNTHYLPDQIERSLSQIANLQLKISREVTILGTGGAYNPLRDWIGSSHLAVINGDIVSTIDVKKIIDHHIASRAGATMVLLPTVIPGESGVFYENEVVTGIGKLGYSAAKCGNFACMQVLAPEFFSNLPTSGSFDIISTGYKALLERKEKIAAVVHQGLWHDIRSPEFYFAALIDLKSKWLLPELSVLRETIHSQGVRFERCPQSPNSKEPFVIEGAVIDPSAVIGEGAVIESGASIGKEALVKSSLILPGAVVSESQLVEQKIIGKNFSISLCHN